CCGASGSWFGLHFVGVSDPGLHDLHAELTALLEREPRLLLVLRDGRDDRAARADQHLPRPDDARALPLEELAVDRDVAGAGDLAVGEHADRADDQLGAFAEVDRAVLEQAVDLDVGAGVELQARVAQDVAAAEVAARTVAGRGRGGAAAGEHGDRLRALDAAAAVAVGADIDPRRL